MTKEAAVVTLPKPPTADEMEGFGATAIAFLRKLHDIFLDLMARYKFAGGKPVLQFQLRDGINSALWVGDQNFGNGSEDELDYDSKQRGLWIGCIFLTSPDNPIEEWLDFKDIYLGDFSFPLPEIFGRSAGHVQTHCGTPIKFRLEA